MKPLTIVGLVVGALIAAGGLGRYALSEHDARVLAAAQVKQWKDSATSYRKLATAAESATVHAILAESVTTQHFRVLAAARAADRDSLAESRRLALLPGERVPVFLRDTIRLKEKVLQDDDATIGAATAAVESCSPIVRSCRSAVSALTAELGADSHIIDGLTARLPNFWQRHEAPVCTATGIAGLAFGLLLPHR